MISKEQLAILMASELRIRHEWDQEPELSFAHYTEGGAMRLRPPVVPGYLWTGVPQAERLQEFAAVLEAHSSHLSFFAPLDLAGVAFINEAHFIGAPMDDPAAIDEIRRAAAEGRLDDHPGKTEVRKITIALRGAQKVPTAFLRRDTGEVLYGIADDEIAHALRTIVTALSESLN